MALLWYSSGLLSFRKLVLQNLLQYSRCEHHRAWSLTTERNITFLSCVVAFIFNININIFNIGWTLSATISCTDLICTFKNLKYTYLAKNLLNILVANVDNIKRCRNGWNVPWIWAKVRAMLSGGWNHRVSSGSVFYRWCVILYMSFNFLPLCPHVLEDNIIVASFCKVAVRVSLSLYVVWKIQRTGNAKIFRKKAAANHITLSICKLMLFRFEEFEEHYD